MRSVTPPVLWEALRRLAGRPPHRVYQGVPTEHSTRDMHEGKFAVAFDRYFPHSSGETHAGRYGDWFGRMLVPTWSADFSAFVNETAAALAEADGISDADARDAMVTAYRLEVAPALLRTIVGEPSVRATMPVVAQAVERLVALPRTSLLRQLARRVYRSAGWISSDVISGMEVFARRASGAKRARGAITAFLAGRESR